MSRTGASIDIGPPSNIGSKVAQAAKEGLPSSPLVQQEPSIEGSGDIQYPPTIGIPDPSTYLSPTFRVKCMNTTIKEIIPPIENVVIIKSTDSVATAFEILIKYKILSVPLMDVTTNMFVAFLNLLDILAYMVDIYQYQTSDTVIPRFEELIIQDRFKNTPVSAIIYRALRNPWYTISESNSIYDAFEMLNKCQVYQLAVADTLGRFYSVLTHFRLLVWLANRNISEFGDLASEAIETFNLGFKPVVRFHKSRRVLDAFLQMDAIGITGIAITNDEDRIIGNISISDLKDIGSSAANFKKLYLDCGTFIEQRETGVNVPKLIWANRRSSIKEVLGQFKAHKIHRVYIIEPQSHMPVGVITTTDIISLFARALQPPASKPEQLRE